MLLPDIVGAAYSCKWSKFDLVFHPPGEIGTNSDVFVNMSSHAFFTSNVCRTCVKQGIIGELKYLFCLK